MNSDEDNNPFADPSIRQATAQNMFVDYFLFNFIIQLIDSSSNQQTLNEYNPFTNKTVAAKVCLFELFFYQKYDLYFSSQYHRSKKRLLYLNSRHPIHHLVHNKQQRNMVGIQLELIWVN